MFICLVCCACCRLRKCHFLTHQGVMYSHVMRSKPRVARHFCLRRHFTCEMFWPLSICGSRWLRTKGQMHRYFDSFTRNATLLLDHIKFMVHPSIDIARLLQDAMAPPQSYRSSPSPSTSCTTGFSLLFPFPFPFPPEDRPLPLPFALPLIVSLSVRIT